MALSRRGCSNGLVICESRADCGGRRYGRGLRWHFHTRQLRLRSYAQGVSANVRGGTAAIWGDARGLFALRDVRPRVPRHMDGRHTRANRFVGAIRMAFKIVKSCASRATAMRSGNAASRSRQGKRRHGWVSHRVGLMRGACYPFSLLRRHTVCCRAMSGLVLDRHTPSQGLDRS